MTALRPSVADRLFGESRWIPWIFVAAFLVVFAVNGVMISFALSSFSGLASDRHYEDGLAWNRVLAEADRQAALGWTADARVARAPGQGREIVVRLTDRDGRPVTGAAVFGDLRRPAERAAPVLFDAVERTPGEYAAFVALPRGGNWELHVRATRGDDRLDRRRRLSLD